MKFLASERKLFSILLLTFLSFIGVLLILRNSCDNEKYFDVIISPFNYQNYISQNVEFFSDGSFTVNNNWASVNDITKKLRYGYVMSYYIDAKHSFNSVVVELNKSELVNGNVEIDLRASTDKYLSATLTNWHQLRESDNKIIFYPNAKYRYLQFRITFDSEPLKPVVKSLYIKACQK